MSKIVGIDLFCGIGGLTHGLYKAGIDIKAGFDNDQTCHKSFSQIANGSPEFICKDIKELEKRDFIKYFDNLKSTDFKLVAGCAPCQPYSSHQKKKNNNDRSKHGSYGLINEYIRVVEYIKPHFVIMENVRQLDKDPLFNEKFIKYFENNNYFIDKKIVDMADYGAPQRRKRLLFLATRKDVPNYNKFTISTSKNVKKQTVFDAIGHLPKIKDGEVDKKDSLHQSSKLSRLNLERIKHSKPGGTWKDWPKELLLECYKKESGKTYTSVYGRLKKDSVSSTLTTQFTRYGTGRYGHYDQNRALSLREGAILQTFPENYEFNSELGSTIISRQIGNAVPPIFAEVLGKEIIKNIKNNK